MSVLDLDFYKLTMLQFIWKHYADVPVTFRLHSRKQDLADVVIPSDLQQRVDEYRRTPLTIEEGFYLKGLGIFEEGFIRELAWLSQHGLPEPTIGPGFVEVSGGWFNVTLWETVILSMVTEQYSKITTPEPSLFKTMEDVKKIDNAGAKWVDFGTRRRWSQMTQEVQVRLMAGVRGGTGLMGTSNVDIARRYNLKPTGTYAHELEMVLRPYFKNEFSTTRNVLEKWGAMYPREQRIALTDTYTTETFFDNHGYYLLDNDWSAVRLDSGNPFDVGGFVDDWLARHMDPHEAPFTVVFSDGLVADTIVDLQHEFHPDGKYAASFVTPVFGWGTGFTNPNSNLSLVMKAVESNGQKTYKITDDNEKSIR